MNTFGQILLVGLAVLLVVGAIYGVAQAATTGGFQIPGGGGEDSNDDGFNDNGNENENDNNAFNNVLEAFSI